MAPPLPRDVASAAIRAPRSTETLRAIGWFATEGPAARASVVPSATVQILNAGGGWNAKRTGDFDGDGKADIVWENVDASVALWLMNGTAMSSGAGIIGPASGWSVSGASP